ncbi:hypothetical protein K7432_010513 [Basidiobolus ranarum]|uniref:Uncharacterized protein n=1 Tax=Basidiobolus ranarum TaxID=34480 RepID=A0ABR2WNN0_9FUNG
MSLHSVLQIRFSPGSSNMTKAFSNWERKSQYILHELIKYQTYAECLRGEISNELLTTLEDEDILSTTCKDILGIKSSDTTQETLYEVENKDSGQYEDQNISSLNLGRSYENSINLSMSEVAIDVSTPLSSSTTLEEKRSTNSNDSKSNQITDPISVKMNIKESRGGCNDIDADVFTGHNISH